MRKHFKKISSHPLISGSAIIFVGTFSANLLNFLFNVFMSRNLSVPDYGTLASLVSIILIFALVADSFVPTVVHFAASFIAKDEEQNLLNFFLQINKICLFISLIIFSLIFLLSSFIANFFNLSNSSLVILVAFIVFFSFISLPNRGIIQAKLNFLYLSLISFATAVSKLTLGVMMVLLGFKVFGALFGFLGSFMIQYLLTFVPTKQYYFAKKGASKVTFGQIINYGGPAALSLIFLTFFITSDLILVKHFFSPDNAGIYAGLSLIGRVIYFISAPISIVMFPLVVNRKAKNEEYRNIFKMALFFVFLISLGLTIFYYFFPEFIIRLFLKKESYLTASSLLGLFGFFITLYSILAVVTNFFLSVKKTRIFIPIAAGAISQSVLIWFFHSDFLQIISISMIIVALTLAVLLLYYVFSYETSKKR